MEHCWATHYTFIKFGQFSEHFIPKDGIETWFDLKYDLDDHVDIDHRFIDIAINGKLVFYDNKTLLQDIDIKPTDVCFVLFKPHFDQSLPDHLKRENEYSLMADAQIQQNRVRIQNKNNHPLFNTSMRHIQASLSIKQIYKKTVKQFSKWQSLIAINQCKGKQDTIRQYLIEGRARPILFKIVEQQQKKQIDAFLNLKVIKQLKETVFSLDKSPQTYGDVMRQLYQQYPYFKELQLNHQAYIQRKLLNIQLFPSQNIQLQTKVKKLLISVQIQQQEQFITSKYLQEFRVQYSQVYTMEEIERAILQSGNNLTYARQLLEQKVDNSKNLVMCLKKSSRLNLILQFFSQPTFQKVRPSLAGNKDKCQAFVNLIISIYKSHVYLVSLIKKYRSYVITILSNIYSLEAKVVQQKTQLAFQEQLTEQQQLQQCALVQDKLDCQLVEYLRKGNVYQHLAISSVRAAHNQLQQVQKFLILGGINKKYDFCVPTLQQEQKYLEKYFKKDKETLLKLKDRSFYLLWLGSIKQTSPFLFEIAIRNKRFLDKLIGGVVKNK